MWAGMIFGGTALQTIILAFITYRCDWEKEVLIVIISNIKIFIYYFIL